MKRQTIYKGVTIETEIILNFNVERSPNGKRWHKVIAKTISDKADEQFETSDEILSHHDNIVILALCEHLENKVKDFLDKTEKVSDVEQFFINNGFVKSNFGK
jgi:hypothetical protein